MTVSFRTDLASRQPPGAAVMSLRAIARGLRVEFPIGFSEIAELLKPVTLQFALKSGELSGYCEATLWNDGGIHFSGRVHTDGESPQSFGVLISFPSLIDGVTYSKPVLDMLGPLGIVLIARQGHVGGTFSFDTRTSTWNETAKHARLSDNWLAVKSTVGTARKEFSTSIGLVDVADAILNGATGFWVFGL
jgi:hypothetical protein